MKAVGRGAIVNVASISGHVAQPNRWTYNATKGAIINMTRCQALDLAPDGIRVNVVSPGWTWTPEVAKAAEEGGREHWEPIWGRFSMLGRLGEAREIVRSILFLCSDDASFITGTELPIDGGYLGLSSEGRGDDSAFAGTA
jgi:NAD(P)-dependent dehydrogenase (short-subunit alcohol dehydrogenase family)